MDYKEVLSDKLKSEFGFDNYKSKQQKKAIEFIYRETFEEYKDIFINLPSGFGKSLCFQLPVVARDNTLAIVITPTILLAKNQVDFLRSKNILAYCWNAYTPTTIKNIIKKDLNLKKPKIKFLYISSDICTSFHFKIILTKIKISYVFVIDEAHCMSSWSHDFRDCYKSISDMRKYCSDVPIITVSACVTEKVKNDIFEILKDPLELSMPCLRKNLIYDIKFIDSLQNSLLDLKKFIIRSLQSTIYVSLTKKNKCCGIIFCEEKDLEELVKNLLALGIQTLSYNHKKLKIKDKLKVLQLWSSGDCQVIIASNDLCLGISNPFVRFVVHWGLPKSIAHFYQESGRAGHDGNLSYCRVYCTYEEMKEPLTYAQTKNFLSDYHMIYQPTQFVLLAQLAQSLTQLKCRHALFLSYFGKNQSNCLDRCDVCINKVITALKIQTLFKRLSLLYPTDRSFKTPIDTKIDKSISNDNEKVKECMNKSQKIGDKKKECSISDKSIQPSLNSSALEIRNFLIRKLYTVSNKSTETLNDNQIFNSISNDDQKSKEILSKLQKIDDKSKITKECPTSDKSIQPSLNSSALEIRNFLVQKLYTVPNRSTRVQSEYQIS